MLGDQLGAGHLLARGASDKRRLAAADVRPTRDAGLFH
jgi:hypothetical protein